MKYLIAFSFSLINCLSHAQMVVPNVQDLGYTLKIISGEDIGTCFIVVDSPHTFLVTAKHMFPNPRNGQKVSFAIDTNSTKMQLTGTLFIDSLSFVDVAIIEPDKFYAEEGIQLKQPEAGVGFEGFFLGFPFNISSADVGKFMGGLPIPLVKRCALSGLLVKEGVVIYLLDGQNNPGFSGGPVFFPMSSKMTERESGLLGIISAYYQQPDSIETKTGAINYSENSGIMIAYSAETIWRILRQNHLHK
jgi:hypothetical protein